MKRNKIPEKKYTAYVSELDITGVSFILFYFIFVKKIKTCDKNCSHDVLQKLAKILSSITHYNFHF
jgi:hypothetical protein